MSEAQAPSRSGTSGQARGQEQQERRSGVRTVAEWFSLGVSALLILGLAGYLVFQGLQLQPPYVPVEARPLLDQARPEGERFILPIEVVNRGDRTLRDLTLEIRSLDRDGKEQSRELQIDYLGERSSQKAFVYLERDPATAQVEVAPQLYLLE